MKDSLSFNLFLKQRFNLQMEGLEREPQRAAYWVILHTNKSFLMLKWILEVNCALKPSFVLEICVCLKK